MKKTIFIPLIVFVVFGIWFYLNKGLQLPSVAAIETNSASHKLLETNLVVTASNAPPAIALLPTEPMNALTATNLEQWKFSIKGLKPLNGFKSTQEWLIEIPGRKIGVPIALNQGGKTVNYSAVLISVSAENGSGNVREVQMQTPNMNIDEIRQLGLQLCDMMGVDSKDFLAWCNKVGNHWLDAPFYMEMEMAAIIVVFTFFKHSTMKSRGLSALSFSSRLNLPPTPQLITPMGSSHCEKRTGVAH